MARLRVSQRRISYRVADIEELTTFSYPQSIHEILHVHINGSNICFRQYTNSLLRKAVLAGSPRVRFHETNPIAISTRVLVTTHRAGQREINQNEARLAKYLFPSAPVGSSQPLLVRAGWLILIRLPLS